MMLRHVRTKDWKPAIQANSCATHKSHNSHAFRKFEKNLLIIIETEFLYSWRWTEHKGLLLTKSSLRTALSMKGDLF